MTLSLSSILFLESKQLDSRADLPQRAMLDVVSLEQQLTLVQLAMVLDAV